MIFAVFLITGVITGISSVVTLLRFDSNWIKSISISSSGGVLTAEYLYLVDILKVEQSNQATMLVILTSSWLVTFLLVLNIFLKSFKKQEAKYKIQTWEIILGNKKVFDDYYTSKKEEIAKIIETEFNIKELESSKNKLESERKKLQLFIDQHEEILDKKHSINIPVDFKYPITNNFFELLPRYIESIADIKHHLSMLTDEYIKKIKESRQMTTSDNQQNYSNQELLKSYLHSIIYYIGTYVFDWRDVRIHFRYFNRKTMLYEKYIASFKSGQEYLEPLTPISSNCGLISLAAQHKRSIVYSANTDKAIHTTNSHIWKDYISMVFENFQLQDKEKSYPILSLGVSVKHSADHRDLLYFLSYIQFEQIIQEQLNQINEEIPIVSTISKAIL